jgi:hypothetical protein
MGGGDSSDAQHWSRIMDKVMETSDWIAIFSKGSMVQGLGPRGGWRNSETMCCRYLVDPVERQSHFRTIIRLALRASKSTKNIA